MPRPYNVEEEHFDGDDDDVSESADDGDDAFAAGVHLDVEEEETTMIAMMPSDLDDGYSHTFTHCEIHPSMILGICASIIFSYPLNFVGLRDGVLNMVGLSDQSGKTSVHVTSTLFLLCVMNGLALKLKNLGLVVALGGAYALDRIAVRSLEFADAPAPGPPPRC